MDSGGRTVAGVGGRGASVLVSSLLVVSSVNWGVVVSSELAGSRVVSGYIVVDVVVVSVLVESELLVVNASVDVISGLTGVVIVVVVTVEASVLPP